MKRTAFLIALLACAVAGKTQTTADYEYVVGRFQRFYNHLQTDSIYGMLSDRSKAIMPQEQTKETFKKLYTQMGGIKSYEYSAKKDDFVLYKTVFANVTLSLVIAINKDRELETFRFIPYQTELNDTDKSQVVLKTSTGDLYGTLNIPTTTKAVPVVLIIAGSGPTDRNGNSTAGVNSNTYKMIADSLQQAGVACLRYDKRGVGMSASIKREESLSFEDYVSDAAGFVKMLKGDNRFSKVFILGHSEGSLIAILVAGKEPVAGIISVAGTAEPIDNIIEKQFSAYTPEMGIKVRVLLDSLKNGFTVKAADGMFANMFRTSVQPYMRSWMKYNPGEEIKKLHIPILVVHGTTDIQVGTEEAEKLVKASSYAKPLIVNGMNHALKQAAQDRQKNIATYSNPILPLSAGLMQPLIQFIKNPPSDKKK